MGQLEVEVDAWKGRREELLNIRPRLVPSEGEEQYHGAKAQGIRHQGRHHEELCQLPRRPSSLQVPPSMVQRHARNGQRKDIALDQRRRQEGPRVYQRQLWDEVQVRDDDLRVDGPLLVAYRGGQD